MTNNLEAPTRTSLLEVTGLVSSPWERYFAAISRAIPLPTIERTQAELADLAKRLGREDAGQLVWVSDFRHMLRWTGSGYEWAPGDGPGGYVQGFAVDPADGWALCDGGATTYLKPDGTTGNYTTPDLIGTGAAAYLKLGDTVSGPNAAVAPTISGLMLNPSATGITATAPASIGNVVAQSGSGVIASAATHTHVVPITDPTHTHSISSATVSATGEPRNVVLRPFFRR